jgi:hypothetical protein
VAWTCQRVSGGQKCRHVNENRLRLCGRCGKAKRKPRRPAHMAALDIPYAGYVEMFGEQCGICGSPPPPGKKLRRDHSHRGDGRPRGLLCWRHNLGLQMFGDDDPGLLRAAAAYLERSADPAATITP